MRGMRRLRGTQKEQRRGEERCAIPRLLFLGEGDGGAPTSTPVSRRCKEGSGYRGGSRRGNGSKRCCGGGAQEGKQ